jgi:dinuclear metal center YbgI/SA1388 family protein
MTVTCKQLLDYLQKLLQPQLFQDYCPNGLQVEGAPVVRKLIAGVSASQALVDYAASVNAQAVLVHHGYFWRNEEAVVVGMKKKRLQTLLQHDINLLAYHLPLDAHPEFGNNIELARQLGFIVAGPLYGSGATALGQHGYLKESTDARYLADHISQCLNRRVLHIAGGPKHVKTLGWCTGGAQGYINKAVELGLDAYISGEISEATVHVAKENGLHYFAAGHHATERYGIQALANHLQQQFPLSCDFVDLDNPA